LQNCWKGVKLARKIDEKHRSHFYQFLQAFYVPLVFMLLFRVYGVKQGWATFLPLQAILETRYLRASACFVTLKNKD